MRVIVLVLAALAALTGGGPAEARDDIMPPPKPAPRIPVEALILEGSVKDTLPPVRPMHDAREVKTAAATAREPRSSTDTQDPRELEGRGQALDGERITVGGREVRLFGIVTPALTSSYGPQTRLYLDRMLSNSNVLCKVTSQDTEGNPVAFCGTVKVPDLSYEMLRQGWAMVDRRTLKGNALSGVYEKAEQEAQTQNRGIFAPAPMAMAVPVSDPTKAVTVPMPETAQAPEPVASAPVLPDIRSALQKLSAGAEEVPAAEPGTAGDFIERYQILLGAFVLMLAAGIFGFFLLWREKRVLKEKRRALAAALRGELMSARLICRTRARELLKQKKTEIEPRHPSQLWPRVRSIVYQAHVSQLGLLGAELARQVASVYGQCADYAAYYQSNAVQRMPIPHVVGETLTTLAEHMDTLLQGLHEVEVTGKALLGEDIMGEEEARAAAENVRLAVAAAQKRALPPPTVTAEAIKSRRLKVREEEEDDGEEGEEETAEAGEAEQEEEEEAKEEKSGRPSRAA